MLLAHFNAAGLLRLRDIVVFALDIRDIPERERNRIGNRIFHTEPVQRSCKLTGLCGTDKQQDDRDRSEILKHKVQVIKKLFFRDDISAAESEEHMLCPVQGYTVLR